MNHVIMGTAGHVDHGKTALIRALTGIECDTHKEEKSRGITINLGFAHLGLSSGGSIGIVDVPGHKDFVHTMVGGASGIDVALLVVAADSGVMPQTREHLQIMDMLGIKRGIVALTKTDLVEADICEMAVEEVSDLLVGTFLEDSPIVRVSSVTGRGLEELRDCIEQVASMVTDRPRGEVLRMFVDRIFTVSGFGTVVTGTVSSGSLKTGGTAFVLPGNGKELRVRRLERHGEEVQEVVAGDRASMNLVGLELSDFQRGMIVSDRILRATDMLDVKLQLFRHSRGFKLWSHALFHLGTFEGPARIHLIDRDRIAGGDNTIAQAHLERPVVAQHGDRFVVRSSSGDITLGGGEIIDASPLHHRKRPDKLVKELAKVAEGELAELIVSETRKRFTAVNHTDIADALNVSPSEVLQVVSGGVPDDLVSYSSGGDAILIVKDQHDALQAQVAKKIAAFHRRHPLEERGRTVEELAGLLGIERGSSGEKLLQCMLANMLGLGLLKRIGNTWALKEHTADISPDMAQKISFVETFLKNCQMRTPLMSELKTKAGQQRIDEQALNEILRHLVSNGKAYFVDGEYLHASVVDQCRNSLVEALAGRDKGMTVAEFRDLVSGNRKICLLLLAIYDGEGVTERQGDLRLLTEKGREVLKNGL
jgi:selenocysteine-specific elongation factor